MKACSRRASTTNSSRRASGSPRHTRAPQPKASALGLAPGARKRSAGGGQTRGQWLQRPACAAAIRGRPVPSRTRPELVGLLPDRLVQVGALEVGDDNRTLGDVVAEDAEGRVELEACWDSA